MQKSELLESARQEARQANARFAALLDAAVDAIVVIDEGARIEVFNRAASEIFGYSAAEVVGKNVNVLMPDPYHSRHDEFMQNYMNTGQAKIIGIGREAVARRKDGSVFPIELSVGEIKDEDEHRFVGIIRNISERKNVENEVRQQREKLAHVTRLSTMGEMAAGIAHEVNQPLTAIATYSNACRRMMKASPTDFEDISDLLEKISTQAMRAGEVIKRLRSFVRKREGELELYPINTLILEVIALAEVDAHSHGIELDVQLAREEMRVLADPVQIQQVLLNLVRNAIDAMDTGTGRKQRVTIRSFRDRQKVIVEVIDTGHGVDETFRENLFTPFLTTKDAGLGLGLSISKSIVSGHKGELLFRDNPEGGSIFYFHLPFIEGELHK